MRLHIQNIQEGLQNKLTDIQNADTIVINDLEADNELFIKLFQHCSQIRWLDIRNETLTTLPDLSSFQQLTRLELKCTSLINIPKDNFPKTLNDFRIIDSPLESLPDFIWQTKNLTWLRLENEDLDTLILPEGIQAKYVTISLPKLKQLEFGKNQTKMSQLEVYASSLQCLPQSLAHLESIETLKINAPINQVACDFSKMVNLRECRFEKWDLADYSFLKAIQKMSFLDIRNSLKKWYGLPDIKIWKGLTRLWIKDCLDTKLTQSVLECKYLLQLYIRTSNIVFEPAYFTNCEKLTDIQLTEVSPVDFADCVKYLPHKHGLSVSKTTLTNFNNIPKGLVVDWWKLYLYEVNITIENLIFLNHFPQLEYLTIHPNSITSAYVFLREKTVPINEIPKMITPFKFKNTKQFLSLCSAIERSGLPRVDKEFFVDYFRGRTKIEVSKAWNWAKILKATNITSLGLKKKLMALIDEKVEQAKLVTPITEKTVLYITGTPKMKITAFRKLVQALGIKLVKTYSKEVTHVVIGTKSADYDLLKEKKFIPITDVELQKQLVNRRPQFLKEKLETKEEGTNEMTTNLAQLLQSPDIINVKLGLEMIKNGGLPASLFPTLLIVQKTTPDAKIRNAIKSILEVYADPIWKPLVRDRLSFKMIHNTEKSGADIRRQVKALAKKLTPTLAAKFSFLLFQKTGKGLRYALTARLKENLKKEAYHLLITDHHFDFSKGMAFSKRPENPYEYDEYNLPESSVALPVLATKLRAIHSLNLTNCRYSDLSEKITKFKDLKYLNLATNELRNLPDYLATLENLEAIDLRENYLSEFPKILSKLPKLKEVNLVANKEKIRIPESFLASHPNCIVKT